MSNYLLKLVKIEPVLCLQHDDVIVLHDHPSFVDHLIKLTVRKKITVTNPSDRHHFLGCTQVVSFKKETHIDQHFDPSLRSGNEGELISVSKKNTT